MKNIDRANTANWAANEEPANYFDEEATLLARPVVPIQPREGKGIWIKPPRFVEDLRRSRYSAGFLAVVVVSAALAGAAGALAINFYTVRNRRAGIVANSTPSIPESVSAETRRPANEALAQSAETARIAEPNVPAVPVLKQESTDVTTASKPSPDSKSPSPGLPAATAQPVKPTPSGPSAEASAAKEKRESRERLDAEPRTSHASEPKQDASRSAAKPDGRESAKQAPISRNSPPDGAVKKDTPQQPAKPPQQDLNRIRDIFEGRHP